ncbi:MAG: 30S ribosomal protein S12 methylthiotransferase RimO [Thermodesulfobacteriota bacterium]|nr:30S ribosomal protein S12 methylthiotransferase RimO [Thermodesulfobacteriota bacterium]
MRKEKVFLYTLGCPKNTVDSEYMMGLMNRAGFDFTSDEKEGEIIIINTCCFIKEAEEESVDAILNLAENKKDGNCKKLIVCGCLPQRYGVKLENLLPEVDFFLGPMNIDKIVEVAEKSRSKKVYIDNKLNEALSELPRLFIPARPYSYLKISEGCSHSCTYCIIPKLRGRLKSRKIPFIFYEAEALVKNGIKELVLVSQDCTAYGQDLDPPLTLVDLCRRLVNIQGLHWLRILYANPLMINKELINLIKKEEKICKYIDMPLQHINEKILRKMGRGATSKKIKGLIYDLRDKIPGIYLRTSFIIGFPGETDKQFEELLEFIRDVRFENLGAFIYSREEGTPAYNLSHQVPEKVKEDRYQCLMTLQKEIAAKKNRDMIGKRVWVLIDEKNSKGDCSGRFYGQAPEIDGKVLIKKSMLLKKGGLVKTEILSVYKDYDLLGRVVLH